VWDGVGNRPWRRPAAAGAISGMTKVASTSALAGQAAWPKFLIAIGWNGA